MKVLFDKVLVKAPESNSRSAAGLFVPQTSDQEQVGPGTVVSAGSEAGPVKEGDSIIFNRFTSHKYKHEGVQYYILGVKEILVVL
jgi:co-chaperonin GroES (HSP10)